MLERKWHNHWIHLSFIQSCCSQLGVCAFESFSQADDAIYIIPSYAFCYNILVPCYWSMQHCSMSCLPICIYSHHYAISFSSLSRFVSHSLYTRLYYIILNDAIMPQALALAFAVYRRAVCNIKHECTQKLHACSFARASILFIIAFDSMSSSSQRSQLW